MKNKNKSYNKQLFVLSNILIILILVNILNLKKRSFIMQSTKNIYRIKKTNRTQTFKMKKKKIESKDKKFN